jgi:hypothetical protein
MWMTLAAFIGGISQSISQNMGPTMAAVLISNLVNAVALGVDITTAAQSRDYAKSFISLDLACGQVFLIQLQASCGDYTLSA